MNTDQSVGVAVEQREAGIEADRSAAEHRADARAANERAAADVGLAQRAGRPGPRCAVRRLGAPASRRPAAKQERRRT